MEDDTIILEPGQLGLFSCDGDFSVILKEDGKVHIKPNAGTCWIYKNPYTHKKFKHDCDECLYLDSGYSYEKHKECDLYFCEQSGIPTVIARYSDEGIDYVSGTGTNDADLRWAERIAKDAGLLEIEDDN